MNKEVLADKRISTMTRIENALNCVKGEADHMLHWCVLFGIRGEVVRRSQVRGPRNMRFWLAFWLL